MEVYTVVSINLFRSSLNNLVEQPARDAPVVWKSGRSIACGIDPVIKNNADMSSAPAEPQRRPGEAGVSRRIGRGFLAHEEGSIQLPAQAAPGDGIQLVSRVWEYAVDFFPGENLRALISAILAPHRSEFGQVVSR